MVSKFTLNLWFMFLFVIILTYSTEAYGGNAHNYITNESQKIWTFIPQEIKDHLKEFNESPTIDYDSGDNIRTGSIEEDGVISSISLVRPVLHFWEPDVPSIPFSSDYSKGILIFTSAYRKANIMWIHNMIPAYLIGDTDEAYYWLGRVAHLLEDAAQPSHVHLDAHLSHVPENVGGGSSGLSVRGSTSNVGSTNLATKGTKAVKNLISEVDDVSRVSWKGSTGVGNALSKTTDLNKINHILQPKHNWGNIVMDPQDWDQVSSVIDDVIRTGTKIPYGKEPGVFQATKIVNGKEVVVRYTSGGQIGTAFVR